MNIVRRYVKVLITWYSLSIGVLGELRTLNVWFEIIPMTNDERYVIHVLALKLRQPNWGRQRHCLLCFLNYGEVRTEALIPPSSKATVCNISFFQRSLELGISDTIIRVISS